MDLRSEAQCRRAKLSTMKFAQTSYPNRFHQELHRGTVKMPQKSSVETDGLRSHPQSAVNHIMPERKLCQRCLPFRTSEPSTILVVCKTEQVHEQSETSVLTP
jgi:hypothetical protein